MNKKIIILTLLLITTAFISACSALPQVGSASGSSGGGDGSAAQHTISVSGQGTVSLIPDMASISIGVQTEDANAAQAVANNNAQSELVIQALDSFGVASRDIQTTNFSVFPIQNRNGNGEVVSTTFRVQNTVNVTVRDLDDLGAILDAVITAGANTIGGIRFEVDPERAKEAEDEALTDALADARHKADLLAQAAGVNLVDVLSISVSTFGGPVTFVETRALGVGGGGDISISPGESDLTVQVFVVYEIVLVTNDPPPQPTEEAAPTEESSEE